MNSTLSLRLLRFSLFCAAAVLTLTTGTSAFAQPRARMARPIRLPAVVVSADRLSMPTVNADGTSLAAHVRNADGSITLPGGSLFALPSRADSDGTIMLPDGSVATPNANGTLTLADGSTVDLSQQSANGHRANVGN